MTRGNSNQIQVTRGGNHIALNTEENGVMYFPTNRFTAGNGTLSLDEVVTVPDQKKESHSSTCLFSDSYREILTIVSYSETDKKISF